MSKADDTKNPLLSYLDEMVDKLRTLVPQAMSDGDETAIHHARVATRRLHAAMDVLKPLSSKTHRKDFSKILSKLRKNLGPARDLDVMIGHLAEFRQKHLQTGAIWLTQKLKDARQSASDPVDMSKIMSRLGSWWGLRQEWLESADQIERHIAESLHQQLEKFIEHADAVSGRIQKSSVAELLDPHELRIAGKALRYTLEMAVGGGHRLPARVTRSFKRMQDALGLWHDYVVLNDTALKMSLKHSISHHDAATQRAILDVAKTAVQKADRELAKFGKLWSANGTNLAQTIRGAFPWSVPSEVSESKTDPDPADSAPAEEPPATPAAIEPSAP